MVDFLPLGSVQSYTAFYIRRREGEVYIHAHTYFSQKAFQQIDEKHKKPYILLPLQILCLSRYLQSYYSARDLVKCVSDALPNFNSYIHVHNSLRTSHSMAQ
jgi:hypothetical protein